MNQAIKTLCQIVVRGAINTMSPEELEAIVPLLPEWQAGKDYKVGDVFKHNEQVFEAAVVHSSRSDQPPPSVYYKRKVRISGIGGGAQS